MRIAIVFFSRSGKTAELADTIFSVLNEKENGKKLIQINVLKKTQKNKWWDLSSTLKLKLIATQSDLSEFDLIFFGSEIEGMSPKRKLPDEMEYYLKECKGIEGKKVAVFLDCFGIPGTTLQKIKSILQTRNATVLDGTVFSYLLGLSEQQLEEARRFALAVLQKNAQLRDPKK